MQNWLYYAAGALALAAGAIVMLSLLSLGDDPMGATLYVLTLVGLVGLAAYVVRHPPIT